MQLAARTGAWSGKPLPYLRRVAWIGNTKTNHYLDTGVYVSHDITSLIDVMPTGTTGDIFFGRGNLSFFNLSDTSTYSDRGIRGIADQDYSRIRGDIGFALNRRCLIEWGEQYIINHTTGMSIGTKKIGSSEKGTLTMRFFGVGMGRVYGCKIFDSNGDRLIRNYIPVLSFDGFAELYDRITGEFAVRYGEFIYGELDAASNAPSLLGGGV